MIYRGHDNIKSLIEFYSHLNIFTAKIEDSDFNTEVIRSVIIETFNNYYDTYNDILMPYYIGLIIIYHQKMQARQIERPLTLQILDRNAENFIQLT